MKNSFRVIGCGIIILLGMRLSAQETIIARSQLPRVSQVFLDKYFPRQQASQVVKDRNYLMGTEYEVYLPNSTKVEFDGKGNWKEVDGEDSPIPTAFIPSGIVQYISRNFPLQKITKIEKGASKYEVELTGGVELDFNAKGKFVRID